MENYRIYLTEKEIPTHYYNLRADMKKKPAPLINPGTMQPMTAEELAGVFCEELVAQDEHQYDPCENRCVIDRDTDTVRYCEPADTFSLLV